MAQGGEARLQREAVEILAADALERDEAGLAEDFEVVGDGGAGERRATILPAAVFSVKLGAARRDTVISAVARPRGRSAMWR